MEGESRGACDPLQELLRSRLGSNLKLSALLIGEEKSSCK